MDYIYDVSFITINYNGIKDTCELIDSVHKVVHSVTYEIIITDNASGNDEGKELQKRYPEVNVILSDKNLGFAGGNNIALQKAKGRYIFFINNDTYIEEDNIKTLIDRLESQEKIGMVCPKIRFAWDDRPIQFAGFTPLSKITLRNKCIGTGEADNGQYDKAHMTPFAHGAAMMIKHELISVVKPMWEGYFLYYEEMDWSECINRSGYEIWYEPACTIFHKESRSVGIGSPNKTYYLTRNRLLFAKRNRTGITKYLSYLYQTAVVLTLHCPRFILTGKFNHAKSILKGVKDFYF